MSFATIIAGLVIAFVSGWKLTLVILALSPLMVFGEFMQFLSLKGFGVKTQKVMAKANQVAGEAIGNIRTVAAFTYEETTVLRFQKLLEPPQKLAFKKAQVSGFLIGLSEFLIFGAYTLGTFFLFVLFVFQVSGMEEF
mgnify:CR=1 FL=1